MSSPHESRPRRNDPAQPADQPLTSQVTGVTEDAAAAVSYSTYAAVRPRLLVVSDFDGTLAGISEDAMNVPVDARAVAALARLAGLPDTEVAILSGRDLAQLDQVCPLFYPVARIGSHGAEPEGTPVQLTDEQRDTLDRLAQILEELAAGVPGAFVEYKPFQRVFHYIRVKDEEAVEKLVTSLRQVHPGGARVTFGHKSVEFSVSEETKGTWLAREIERYRPDVAIFIGDDTTDEDGFRALRGTDLSAKVGDGTTAARFRLARRDEVADVFDELARVRATQLGVPAEPAARFSTLAALMTSVVVQVTDWGAPTPCQGWAARDIISHLAGWFRRKEPTKPGLGTVAKREPAATWTRFVRAVDEKLAADPSPALLREIREVLSPDIFLHAWDLATSQGIALDLDESYSREVRHAMASRGTNMHAPGLLGAPKPAPAGATEAQQLLAFTGRQP